nr:hypothetical protein [uncultured Flavobacterium sp.]
MQLNRFVITLLSLILSLNVFSQSNVPPPEDLIAYSPEYDIYTIYYPKGYTSGYETDVIKFSEPKKDGISISPYSYLLKKDITDADLILMLSVTYEVDEANFKSVPSKFSNMVVGTGFSNNKYRMVYAGIFNHRLVVVSISKRSNFTDQELRLLHEGMNKVKIQ